MAGGVDSVVKLAKQLQTPVCTTYLRNDAFPKSHKLWMGKHCSIYLLNLMLNTCNMLL